MLKVEQESDNRVNHIMIADKNNRLYCHLKEQVIKWNDDYYLENCNRCQYLQGLGQNIGTIECSFRSEVDADDDISVTVDDPFLYAESKFKLGIKK